jgi:hypothetical protein
MDYSTNPDLQTVCDVKQPITFEFKSISPELFENLDFAKMDGFDIQVKEVADYWKPDEETIESIRLPYHSASSLLQSDTKSQYITENNENFVVESGLTDLYALNDDYLKPSFVFLTKYDLLMGSKKAVTPLRYHTDHRRFLCVQSGRIRVKMTPFKSRKYLYPIKDYYNYEFRSPVNIWKPQANYMHEYDKIKCLEFDVVSGHVLYVPPYWWYSIQYSDEPTKVASFTYCSIINCIANSPDYFFYFIQQQNTRTRIAKVLEIPEKKEEVEEEKDESQSSTTPIEQSIRILTSKP